MKSFLLLIVAFAIATCSFAQDTTGGTRANIIIPLHKSPAKSKLPPASAPAASGNSRFPLNATDRKLRKAAASKKYRRKSSVRTTAMPALN